LPRTDGALDTDFPVSLRAVAFASIGIDEATSEYVFYNADGAEVDRVVIPAGTGTGGTSNLLWLPAVDDSGTISWTRSSATAAPETVNIMGPQGERGAQGDTGTQGIQGEQGPQGIQGIQGIQGPKGDTGEQGPQGPKGDTGERGETGPQGEQGPQGIHGVQGEPGADGHTPVKGVDYFTDADISGIVSAVLSSIPVDASLAGRLAGS